MQLNEIQIVGFRNYTELSMRFSPGVNVFIGRNGAGKTNLLEAIQVLLSGSSFRSNSIDELQNLNRPKQGFALIGTTTHSAYKNRLHFKHEEGRSQATKDGKRVSRAHLLKAFRTVLFTPESLAAIKSGPAQRRNLVDEILLSVDPSSAQLVTDFSRSLRQRNKLLKALMEDPKDKSIFDVLSSLNEIYLPLSAELTFKRLKALELLREDYNSVAREILHNPSVDISVDYAISGESAVDWDLNQVYDALCLRLKQLAQAEMASGQTLVGPHRHDIHFLYEGHNSRSFCSQGQQRSLVLAVKIAQVLLHFKIQGEYPILLLDDVLSELDSVRQSSLLKVLQSLEAQIFLTKPVFDLEHVFADRKVSVFNVEREKVGVGESSFVF